MPLTREQYAEMGRRGGRARAAKLSTERLSEIGRMATRRSAVMSVIRNAEELSAEERGALRVRLALADG